jgi:hypothetical protein
MIEVSGVASLAFSMVSVSITVLGTHFHVFSITIGPAYGRKEAHSMVSGYLLEPFVIF